MNLKMMNIDVKIYLHQLGRSLDAHQQGPAGRNPYEDVNHCPQSIFNTLLKEFIKIFAQKCLGCKFD